MSKSRSKSRCPGVQWLRSTAAEVGITRITRESHLLVAEVTVEVGTVIEAGIAGVAQAEFVLAGFHNTLFTRQREVEWAVGFGLLGRHRGRHRNRSRSKGSSSPVGRSSSRHRNLSLSGNCHP
jgi:hypothetical protein